MLQFLVPGILLLTQPGYSQITLQIGDFPTAGEMVIKARDTSSAVSPGQAGMNQVWDFSHLIENETDTTLYAIPGSSWYGSGNHPDANLVAVEDNFDQSNPDFFNNNFYYSSNLGWIAKGSENLFSLWGLFTAKMHLFYSGNAMVLPLPFTYGDSHSGSFRIDWYTASFNLSTLIDSIHTISHVTYTQNGDGSGTLITPVGSYQALRVHEVSNFVDSVFRWNASSGWQFDETKSYTLTNYRFYANNIGEVGCYSIDSKKGNPDFGFFKSETLVGMAQDLEIQQGGIYPNPATDYFRLEGLPASEIGIYSLSGSKMMEVQNTSEVNISQLPKGIYLVKAKRNNIVSGYKLLKK